MTHRRLQHGLLSSPVAKDGAVCGIVLSPFTMGRTDEMIECSCHLQLYMVRLLPLGSAIVVVSIGKWPRSLP